VKTEEGEQTLNRQCIHCDRYSWTL